jgi:hypothetical protein
MLCGNVGYLPVEGTHCGAAIFKISLHVPQVFWQLGAAELRGGSPTAAPAAVEGGNINTLSDMCPTRGREPKQYTS